MKRLKVFSRYPVYILTGAGVTVLTVLLRSLIGLLIEDDTTAKYISSMILAYIFGIGFSFLAHKNITFQAKHRLSITKTLSFVAIHLIGMSLTLVSSITLRQLLLDDWFPVELSKLLGFAISAFGVSLITYLLKTYIVFD
ncbi:MAG: GtrA family protein [Microcoleaceae cyanobacterium]